MMKQYLTVFFVAFALVAGFSGSSKARTYVWSDPVFDYTLAFPDSWNHTLATADPDGVDRIKMIAPGRGQPNCRVAAKRDKRFTIYPRRLYPNVVYKEIRWPHWDQVTAAMDERFFYFFQSGGVSHGDARYTLLDFEIPEDSNKAVPESALNKKRALIYASIYGDFQMIVQCTAPQASFSKYLADFNKLISGIHFRPQYHPHLHGYYRDFLESGDRSIHKMKPKLFETITRQAPEPIVVDRYHK